MMKENERESEQFILYLLKFIALMIKYKQSKQSILEGFKHKLSLSNRENIDIIGEYIYMQYF